MFYWHNIAGRNTARDGQCVCVCGDKKTISNGIHHNNILSHFLCVIFARLDYPNFYFYLWTDMKKVYGSEKRVQKHFVHSRKCRQIRQLLNGTRFRRNHLSNVFQWIGLLLEKILKQTAGYFVFAFLCISPGTCSDRDKQQNGWSISRFRMNNYATFHWPERCHSTSRFSDFTFCTLIQITADLLSLRVAGHASRYPVSRYWETKKSECEREHHFLFFLPWDFFLGIPSLKKWNALDSICGG